MTDTGHRSGTDVVQAYLTFPRAAGEPPGQLAAFSPVTLGAGATRTVTLHIASAQLATYQPSGWTTVAGRYTVGVGDSSATQPTHATLTVVHA